MSKLGSQVTEIQEFGGLGQQTEDAEGLQGSEESMSFPRPLRT